MKPETEIRNLKREVRSANSERDYLRSQLRALESKRTATETRAVKAEAEVADWKRRFDIVLERLPSEGVKDG